MKPPRFFQRRLPAALMALAIGAVVLPSCGLCAEKIQPIPAGELRAAVNRAIPLLERSSAFTLQERACFTCHHGTHPTLALNEAWARGFAINKGNFEDQLERAHRELINDLPRFKQGWSVSKTADGPAQALWLLGVTGWKPGAVTAATVEFFLNRNAEQAYWDAPERRPPTVGSPFTTTFLVLRALKFYGTEKLEARINTRLNAAEQWLLATPSDDTEDSVHRLRALRLLDADHATFQAEANKLLDAQHEDGGWPQLSQMTGDAYATGTVLAALHDTGAISITDAAYQRGLRYLLKTQNTNGSWHVTKRTHAAQPFFESAFPHGQDQFISISATSWAAYSLMQALPKTASVAYFVARPQALARLRAGIQQGETPVFSAEQLAFFRKKIQPVLSGKCYSCHSTKAKTLKASLYLDTRGGVLSGGESGPAIRTGDPEHSLLIQALEGDKLSLMPPKKHLSPAVIGDFKKWIEMGAPDPRGELPALTTSSR